MHLRRSALFAVLVVTLAVAAACGRSGLVGGSEAKLEFGNGRDEAHTVAGIEFLDFCSSVTHAEGDMVRLPFVPSAFTADRTLLLIQVQDTGASVVTTAASPAPGSAGLWETTRIESVFSATSLRVSPAVGLYLTSGARHAQACMVPEYETLTIESNATLTVAGWNGSYRGVIAFVVKERLEIQSGGRIVASGQGFRGGVDDHVDEQAPYHEEALDYPLGGDPDSSLYGRAGGKGESLHGASYQWAGRGNRSNGGGGGNAHNSGGGGGGNGGLGGAGGMENPGDTPPASVNGGMPGAAVFTEGARRLTMGGGGGAGHRNNDSIAGGGEGGGIVVIAARAISGSGSIVVDGSPGDGDESSIDGGGGGGGGGTIYLRTLDGSGFSGVLSARGGPGGIVGGIDHGPGGGGGGGRILLDVPDRTPVMRLEGGPSGLDGSGAPYGASAGSAGVMVPF